MKKLHNLYQKDLISVDMTYVEYSLYYNNYTLCISYIYIINEM